MWATWKDRLEPWGVALLDLMFPVSCILCDQGETKICDECRDKILQDRPETCRFCAMPLGPFEEAEDGCTWCRHKRLGFDGAVALGAYKGGVRDFCLKLKRVENLWMAKTVVRLLIDKQGPRLRDLRPTMVVSVPLHWWRRACRGYDQADHLAALLAKRLSLPHARVLRRVVHTPKLRDCSKAERSRKLKGAFRLRSSRRLQGQRILLVDDILTTGATCGAAARLLKDGGAARVFAVVLGRAEGYAS